MRLQQRPLPAMAAIAARRVLTRSLTEPFANCGKSSGPLRGQVLTLGFMRMARWLLVWTLCLGTLWASPATAVFTAAPAATSAFPLPANSGVGRRVVYSESRQHVWLVSAAGEVVRHYAVTGRADWPRPGNYKVFSKSTFSVSWDGRFYMYWMTRFVKSVHANIGFHSIPKTWAGVPIQKESDLGKPLGIGGCVRLRYYAAKFLYTWAKLGTPVVVLR